jgi:hypothetical protein
MYTHTHTHISAHTHTHTHTYNTHTHTHTYIYMQERQGIRQGCEEGILQCVNLQSGQGSCLFDGG